MRGHQIEVADSKQTGGGNLEPSYGAPHLSRLPMLELCTALEEV